MADQIPMGPTELAEALVVLGFKGTHPKDTGSGALARWRGCDPTTVSAYLTGRVPVPTDLARLLRLMVRAQVTPVEIDTLPVISRG